MSFSKRLREARESKGLTSKQMATFLGVAPSSYCQYETGKREPDVLKITAISKILGISADYLIFGEETASIVKNEINELIEYYNKLNFAGKLKAIEYISDLTTIKKYIIAEDVES